MISLIFYVHPWLGWAGDFVQTIATKMGGFGLMLVAMGDSSFLTIPEGNDLLLVILSTGNSWKNVAFYVAMTITGSVLGCLLLYALGRKGGSPLLRRRFAEKNVARAEKLFERYGLLTVAVPSLLPPPCPFKIFVLSAGVFRLKLWEFLAAVIVGRTVRYSMWGILAVVYGKSVAIYMRRNLHLVGAIVFAALLLVIITLVWHRLRSGKDDAG